MTRYIAACLLCLRFVLSFPPVYTAVTHSEEITKLLDLDAKPNSTLLEKIQANLADDLFLLYTRKNWHVGQVLKFGDDESVSSSNFNASIPTVVVVHGWFENARSPINPTIKSALLLKGDVNVIVMDWSRLSISDYVTATMGVPSVGRGLGAFLAFLNDVTGMSYDSVHLVGFSLGAHVVGNAGRELDGQIARITALDPAGPLWYLNDNRLRDTDAVYVEAIHTNAGLFGISIVVGDADFFPNGGSSQPGCSDNILCNHSRSWQLFSSTVVFNHLGGKLCKNPLQFLTNVCLGRSFPMGNNNLKKFGTGVYSLTTLAFYPY